MQETKQFDLNAEPTHLRCLTLTEQVAVDLNSFINQGADRQKRVTLISKKIGIHQKTLNRICQLENKPSYNTVFKIYRFLLNETNDSEVLQKCPVVIRDYLKKSNPQTLEKSVFYSTDVELELKNNPVALELVVLCSTSQISEQEIKERFGAFGLQTARTLVVKKILAELKLGIFSIGQLQMNMSPEMVIKMGLQITNSYAKPENGEEKGLHFHSFYAEGLTAEAFQLWVKIDEEAFLKKVQIAKNSNSLGKIKAYTFNSTDTLANKE